MCQVLVTAIIVSTALLAVACDGQPAIVTPTPAPVTTSFPFPSQHPSTPLPDILSGKEVIKLEPGPPTTLPASLSIIVETGCFGCAGEAQGITRYYVGPDGELAPDTLLDPGALGAPPRILDTPEGPREYPPSITGIVMSPDASEIIISVCVRARCSYGEGGPSDWEAESRTALYRSRDGGVTWHSALQLDAGASVEVRTGLGAAVVAVWETALEATFYRIALDDSPADSNPTMDRLTPPAPGAWPVAGVDTDVLWLVSDGGRILREDGSTFIDFAGSGSINRYFFVEEFGAAWIAWASPVFFSNEGGTFGVDRSFLSKVDAKGAIGSTVQYDNTARYGVDIGNGMRIGNAQLDPKTHPEWNWFPSVFDIPNRQVRPILDPFAERGNTGRNIVAAVQRGPFARVVNTDNTCLNIRAEPLPSAGILDCAAEGVLLRDTGEAGGPAGEWLKVVTPNGAEGWANAQYLER